MNWYIGHNTVKLGFKERLNEEQLGNSEPFSVTNMPVHIINSEQIGFSEQPCDDQKVPYYQVRLYIGHPLIGSSKKHAKTERPIEKWVEIISEGAFLFLKTSNDRTIYSHCLDLDLNSQKTRCNF